MEQFERVFNAINHSLQSCHDCAEGNNFEMARFYAEVARCEIYQLTLAVNELELNTPREFGGKA